MFTAMIITGPFFNLKSLYFRFKLVSMNELFFQQSLDLLVFSIYRFIAYGT